MIKCTYFNIKFYCIEGETTPNQDLSLYSNLKKGELIGKGAFGKVLKLIIVKLDCLSIVSYRVAIHS